MKKAIIASIIFFLLSSQSFGAMIYMNDGKAYNVQTYDEDFSEYEMEVFDGIKKFRINKKDIYKITNGNAIESQGTTINGTYRNLNYVPTDDQLKTAQLNYYESMVKMREDTEAIKNVAITALVLEIAAIVVGSIVVYSNMKAVEEQIQ